VLGNTIGNPLKTTIALSHLIFEGTLDRFPGLKICAAHGGGYLPSYAARSDAILTTFPDRHTKTLAKRPSEYLRQLYYDSLVFTPEALRHLIAETGASQIVMGTDYPYPWTSTAVQHILDTPDLTDAERGDSRRKRGGPPWDQIVAHARHLFWGRSMLRSWVLD
jgi:aminocarboxymuconate-semialdehyde decarboxylase